MSRRGTCGTTSGAGSSSSVRNALPHDSRTRSWSLLSSSRAARRRPRRRATPRVRECRRRAIVTACARRAGPRRESPRTPILFRTWHTSRTSRAVTFRTTAPRFGSKSTTPIPRSSISASRMGVWLTRNRDRERIRDQPLPGAQVAVEDIGEDGANDRGPAEAVVERSFN